MEKLQRPVLLSKVVLHPYCKKSIKIEPKNKVYS